MDFRSGFQDFKAKHFGFLALVVALPLVAYAVEEGPLWQKPQLTDDEFNALLETAFSTDHRSVKARASQCVLDITIDFANPCYGADGRFWPGTLDKEHWFFDLSEARDVELREAENTGDNYHIRLNWDDHVTAAATEAHKLFYDNKAARNYDRKKGMEHVEILFESTELATAYLERQGIKSRDMWQTCSGYTLSTGVDEYSDALLSKNPVMIAVFDELRARHAQCRK